MQYSGECNLNGMEDAENYNAAVTATVVRRIRPQDAVLVDFGAGSGWLAQRVSGATGRPVRCVEPAENMRAYLPPDSPRTLGEIADGTVDFLYSSNVLEHIEDDAAALADIRRVLKPGGRVFLYLPAFQCLFSSMDRTVGHFRRYDKRMLRRLFRRVGGWRVLEMRYADSLGFLATVAFKAVDRTKGAFPGRQVRFYDRWVFPASLALDKLTAGLLFGKNVMLCAEKTATPPPETP